MNTHTDTFKSYIIRGMIMAALVIPLSCVCAGASYGSENDQNGPAHVTSVKEWEPGLVQGHGNGKFLYYNLPEFLANLDTDGKQPRFIKLKATLEASTKADIDAIDADLPIIRNSLVSYLRSLHPDDMTDPKLIKMREDLLKDINKLITPNKISDILYQEIIIQ